MTNLERKSYNDTIQNWLGFVQLSIYEDIESKLQINLGMIYLKQKHKEEIQAEHVFTQIDHMNYIWILTAALVNDCFSQVILPTAQFKKLIILSVRIETMKKQRLWWMELAHKNASYLPSYSLTTFKTIHLCRQFKNDLTW